MRANGAKDTPPSKSNAAVQAQSSPHTPTADSEIGAAVPLRTTWTTDLCSIEASVQAGTVQLDQALVGAVLDIAVLPEEDETLWIVDDFGVASFGGLVGDVLNEIAASGGFRWNALEPRLRFLFGLLINL